MDIFRMVGEAAYAEAVAVAQKQEDFLRAEISRLGITDLKGWELLIDPAGAPIKLKYSPPADTIVLDVP